MSRNGVHLAGARRWFWVLVGVAVLAMSALYGSINAEPGPAAGLVVLVSGLLLAGTTIQAARIWFAVDGSPRLRHRRASSQRTDMTGPG